MSFDQIDNNLKLAVGASKSAFTPLQVGKINVLPITDSDASDTPVACYLNGIFNLSVTGADDMGNAAISIGDYVYLDTGVLNVDSVNGVKWGIAIDAVSSGATSTIRVMMLQV